MSFVFLQIEYLIENDSNINVKIQDINLVGDFLQMAQDYQNQLLMEEFQEEFNS